MKLTDYLRLDIHNGNTLRNVFILNYKARIIMSNLNRPTTVMISGYYGFGNAGDEAILAAIVQGLKREIPDVDIIVLSESPSDTVREHNVKSHDRKDYPGIFGLMGGIDLLISGGGGLVQDVTGFTTVVYYLIIVKMALMRGKKVMFFAQGFGPIRQSKSRMFARYIMNGVSLISYRDEESKQLCRSLGITTPPIFVTADPVFALEPAKEEVISPIAAELGITDGEVNIGISVRPWKSDSDYVNTISAIIDYLAHHEQANIFLFPFQDSQDMEVCKSILTKTTQKTKIIPRNYPIPVMMGLIGKMNMIMGMRLHSLIFAAAQNVPCVGISYDSKVTNVMESLELPYLKINRVEEQTLLQMALKTLKNREEIKKHLPSKVEIFRNNALKNFELVKALL